MSFESIKAQLTAISAMVEAIQADLDNYDESPGYCNHPEEDRIDLSTMGVKAWECGVCGYQFKLEGR